MPDPLDRIEDERLKAQLDLLRTNTDSVIESSRLRTLLMGFRGQKGIYKPAGSPYALWVRETMGGPYADHPPEVLPDGSWTYRYSPEAQRGVAPMDIPTNRALLRCQADRVPVGVLRQRIDRVGNRAYEVMGLAYVEGFDGTHFLLRGEPLRWESVSPGTTAIPRFEPYDPAPRPELAVIRQQREHKFAAAVRWAYHEKCSLCEIGFRLRGRPLALDAAHIIPVEERGTSLDVRNGLLLCKNHHALFDQYAWVPDEDYRVMVTPEREFRTTAIANHLLKLEGRRLPNLPSNPVNLPAQEAIHYRLERFA